MPGRLLAPLVRCRRPCMVRPGGQQQRRQQQLVMPRDAPALHGGG
jgi:hypothetical protein